MAKLTPAEQKALDKLQAKAEAPEAPPTARSISFSVNLGNKEEVDLARRLGLIDDGDDDEEEDTGTDGEEDDTPRRPGYFGKDK